MTRPSSQEIQKQDQIALERPPILTDGTRLAPDLAEPCADGDGGGYPPSDAAALTGENGGGTSGNHGNGTAG